MYRYKTKLPNQMRRRSDAKREGNSPDTRFRFYGEQFLLDIVSGKFYRVTPTAGFILRNLIAGESHDDLANIVQNRFGIDRPRAMRDVELFLSELRSLGIIENPRY